MSEAKFTSGPWEFIPVEVWPFGVRIIAGSNVILHQDAFAHSSKQKSRADCEDGVGFEPKDIDTVQNAIREQDANAKLIAAAPELLDEHKDWAATFGRALVAALQGDYEDVNRLARELKLEWKTDGTPRLKSDAIAKAESL